MLSNFTPWYFYFQCELDNVLNVCGNHKVRPTRQCVCPHGRPEVLYHWPEVYYAMDYACHVSSVAIKAMWNICQFPELSVDADSIELVQSFASTATGQSHPTHTRLGYNTYTGVISFFPMKRERAGVVTEYTEFQLFIITFHCLISSNRVIPENILWEYYVNVTLFGNVL